MENNQLTPNDISNMINIIEVCSTRGAFRANELKNIGTLFEKMNGFLNSLKEASTKKTEEVEEPQQNNIEEVKNIN